jgi:aspartate 1-decarboxylase
MERTLLKSKIHRATVTGADLEYDGSLSLDPELLRIADILPHERVEIYNITNGERLATYAIPGVPGGRQVVANGAAAHKIRKGDLVIICTYGSFSEAEAVGHEPRVILVDEDNRPR